MTREQLWQATLGELELSLSKANFTTWFKNTFISSYEGDQVTIGVPNTFAKAWFENKYHTTILKALQNITDNQVKKIIYKVESLNKTPSSFFIKKEIKEKTVPREAIPLQEIKSEEITINKSGLNPKYTFENFIVGKGNELAQAAAKAVAEKPGQVYNPLFIYGGVGLGKTHLTQAIGHKILKKHKNRKVLYVPCEKFTNEFIQSIRNGKTENFKSTYRSVDTLLVDDIQFLTGKEGTQEEFFHTFNTLHQDNKQIVISSDRPPKAIPTLEHRLISRFEWGMIVDITAPDLETRIAILEAKCKEKNFQLSKEIINHIASHIQNNIRELEGTLNKLFAYHQLNNTPPTLESTKNIIVSLTISPKKKSFTSKELINTVAEFYDIKISDLVGNSRKRELVIPRQITMYLMREELKSSYPNIGQELGGKDHTTAMHACTKITKGLENDEKIKQDIDLIKERLYNP